MMKVVIDVILLLIILINPLQSESDFLFRATAPDNSAQLLVLYKDDTCNANNLETTYPYSWYQSSFDSVSESYIALSNMNPSTVIIIFLNGTSTQYQLTSLGIACTSYNGNAYILYQQGQDIWLQTIILKTRTILTPYMVLNSPTVNFSPGHPLLYLNDNLYIEVENQTIQYNQIIKISLSGSFPYSYSTVNWIPGWISLHTVPGCPYVYGVQQGVLYSINVTSGKLSSIISQSCVPNTDSKQQYLLYSIDYKENTIITLDICGEVNFIIYDYNGKKLSSKSLPCNIGNNYNILGLEVIQGNTLADRCPNATLIEKDSPLTGFDFQFYFYISLGVGVGLILILLIISLYNIHRIKQKRDGYVEIRDDPKNSNTAPSLHEVLVAAGGKIDANEIEINNLIGQGSFANVYKGKIHETEVAVKVIKCISNKDLEQSLLAEAGIMVKLRHPNIVLFMGACIKSPDLFLVTEYMHNGSIREILDTREVIIEAEHIKRFSADACKGMTYLHSRKILHRDLKTHNLLVDSNWNVKVCDFGLSRTMVDQESGTMTACGTPSWAAPEVLRRDHYTHKADVYSFGICLWEMCTRQRPYGDLKPYQVVICVATDGLRPDLQTFSVPPYYEKIMKQCWSENIDERPEFSELRDILNEVKCPNPSHPYPVYRKEFMDFQAKSMPNDTFQLVLSEATKPIVPK